jgi:alkylated DNA repair dioxygenase AlkB
MQKPTTNPGCIPDLFAAAQPDLSNQRLSEGAWLLRGFALARQTDLLAATEGVVTAAPFRNMETPVGVVCVVPAILQDAPHVRRRPCAPDVRTAVHRSIGLRAASARGHAALPAGRAALSGFP